MLAALPAVAAEPQQGPLVLALEEALAIAAEQNHDIQKALEYRNYVNGRYVEERAAALPQVTITASGLHLKDESMKDFYSGLYSLPLDQSLKELFSGIIPMEQDIAAGEVSLTQALFTWGQVSAAIRTAKVGLAIAEDQLRLYRQAAARDVSAAFYDVLLAREVATLAQQNLDQKVRHAGEARRRNEAGTATDYDVLATEVDADNARPPVIRAQNQVTTALERLRFLLALNTGELAVRGSITAVITPYPDYEDALSEALTYRPELTEIGHRRGVAKELITIAKAGDKPRLDFRGAFGWKEIWMDEIDSDGQVWQAGLFVSFPVFDGLRSRGRVTQARSDAATLEIEEAKLRDAIALEVRNAVDAVRESGEIVRAISGTVAQAERLLLMADRGYAYGVKTNLEVQDAQLNLIRAKGSLAIAQRDYLVSCVNLEWVKGTLNLPAK
jgi:HAE1 family hydrophobic/amphiphilic exporter-1